VSGFVETWRRDFYVNFFLFGVTVYFILVAGGPFGNGRYRDPIGFILSVWAGIGVAKFCEKHKKSSRIYAGD
jgi:hypothetical protein